jgi:hypothetical protein
MGQKLLGVLTLLLSGAWWLGLLKQGIEHLLWGRALSLLDPYLDAISLGGVFQYGPPVLLAIIGIYLLLSKRQQRDPEPQPIEIAAPGPNWRLHELFLHIDPNVFEKDRQFRTGDDVKDKLSTRQLKSWGRKIVGSRQLSLAPIPSEFWRDAAFIYPLSDADKPSIWDARSSSGVDYADVQVNRAEATTLWSPPARSISLPDAAAELYAKISDTALGKRTKDNCASEEEIWDTIGTMIIRRGTVAGRTPGSSQLETLNTSVLWYARVVGGAKVIRANTTESKTNFTDLQITRSALNRVIEDIKSTADMQR